LHRIFVMQIVYCDNWIPYLVQAPSHICAHPANSDKTDSGGFHKGKINTFAVKKGEPPAPRDKRRL
jgi:hypothetical protein